MRVGSLTSDKLRSSSSTQ